MTAIILGGVGLFLVGMVLMTQGLQDAAGDTLRTLLHRFTKGPITSLATGTVFTALVQSSSATTLATIGFVGAGLITFSQSVGIILGSNLGTTVTSWLVSLIGFKIKIDAFALPMIGIGALLKLFLKGRISHLGTIIAGFGLIFLGIEFLQNGMAGLSEHLDVSRIPATGLGGRLLLVLFGIVVTVVMQSSSAAVATTLTAVHTGVIGVEHAAAIVIGQNVGTTVTAGVGTIGASTAAKRTALAHVIFNLATGLAAFLLLPLFGLSVSAWESGVGAIDAAVTIAIFHTGFNLLGVALFLPFLGRFSAWIERILPDKKTSYSWRLKTPDEMVPEVAVDAARLTLLDVVKGILEPTLGAARRERPWKGLAAEMKPFAEAVGETRNFLGALPSTRDNPTAFARHLAAHHAADHLMALVIGLKETVHERYVPDDERVSPILDRVAYQWTQIVEASSEGAARPDLGKIAASAADVSAKVKAERARLLEETAAGEISAERAGKLLASVAWLERAARHAWRASHHLWTDAIEEATDGSAADREDEPEVEGELDPFDSTPMDDDEKAAGGE